MSLRSSAARRELGCGKGSSSEVAKWRKRPVFLHSANARKTALPITSEDHTKSSATVGERRLKTGGDPSRALEGSPFLTSRRRKPVNEPKAGFRVTSRRRHVHNNNRS
ncbi:hypothetical protein SKAU_G00184900 [Synaphobranchus kaupii]|uniref:Uncharacterized protein n=1 Tax=Synaphobranchus kaupii TaxID=118154 RepID=A0A9Q1FC92_SYNKA|nr:hypothetical protein SKAU_G00184900 [Synaphobranchus kaupii]